MMMLEQTLAAMAEPQYKIFNDKLICTAFPSYGVRIPAIRNLAKELHKKMQWEDVCNYCPQSFEGVVLKGLLIAKQTDFDKFCLAWDNYYPLFDSWAQTDTVVPSLGVMKQHSEQILQRYLPLKTSKNAFDRRFLVILLLSYFITDQWVERAV